MSAFEIPVERPHDPLRSLNMRTTKLTEAILDDELENLDLSEETQDDLKHERWLQLA